MVVQGVNETTYAPTVTVFEVTGPGEREILHQEELTREPESRYTPEEQKKIDMCNAALSKKGKEPLSEEEIDYMLDPGGRRKWFEKVDEKIDDLETMQRMAGYRVEKRIIPLDDDQNS